MDSNPYGFSLILRVRIDGVSKYAKMYNSLGQIAYIETDIPVPPADTDIVVYPIPDNIEEADAYIRGSAKLMQPEAYGTMIEQYDRNNTLIGLVVVVDDKIQHYSLDPSSQFHGNSEDYQIAYPIFKPGVNKGWINHALMKISKRMETGVVSTNLVKGKIQMQNLVSSFNRFASSTEKRLQELTKARDDLIKYKEMYEREKNLPPKEYDKYMKIPAMLLQINEQRALVERQSLGVIHDIEKLAVVTKLLNSAS